MAHIRVVSTHGYRIGYSETTNGPDLEATGFEAEVVTQDLIAPGSQAQCAAIDIFNADMNWFEENVLRDDWHGPYLFGDLFSLTDIAFFTVFQTVRETENALDKTIAAFQPSVEMWQHNIAERPSIQQAVQIQERISF